MKLSEKIEAFSTKKKFMLYVILYTIISVFVISISFSFFKTENKGFGWAIDSLPVQLPMFTQLKIYVRGIFKNLLENGIFQVPLYTFNIGMGADIITYLSMWYLEPISFLGIFGGYDQIEIMYDFLTIFRIYLSGLSFGIFCFYMNKNKVFPVTIGSLIYVFSGWTFFFIRHPVFFSTLIYLPLLLIGVEKLSKENKGLFFSVMVFFSSWTHYYFLYINTIFIGIYFLVRHFEIFQKTNTKLFIKKFFALIKYYILGIGLSMIVLLPNIITFMNSNRNGKILETGSLWNFGDNWFEKLFLSICGPSQSPGYFLHNGFLPLGIISILFCIKQLKGKKSISIFAYIITILFTLPLFTFILHGFSSIHFRWNYVIGLLAGYSLVYILCKHKDFKYSDSILAVIFILIYSGIQVFNPILANNNTIAGTFFLILSLVVLLTRLCTKNHKLLLNIALLIIVCINIYINARLTFSIEFGNYVSEFVTKNESINLIKNTSASTLTYDSEDFYRIDSANSAVSNENANIFLKNYGVSFYVNVMDKYFADYNYGLENSGTRLLDNINNDNRTIIEELASVKYFTTYDNQDAYLPYGYSLKLETTDTNGKLCKVYENNYALPLGYTYDKSIIEEDYNTLNALEKQEVLMKAVIVDSSDDKTIEINTLPSDIIKSDSLTISGTNCNYDTTSKKLTVSKNGGYLTIEFPSKKGCETYIRLKNLNIDSYKDAYWQIVFFNDDISLVKNVEIRSNTATYSYNCYDHLVNLGYSEEGISQINVGFPFTCEISLDDIEIYYQPMDTYSSDVAALKEDILTNVTISSNSINGNISLEQSKYLVFSIPYSKGWTAYVNGKKTPLERMNITYMGLELDPGEYTIELKYMTPGLIPGAIVTVFSIIVILIDGIYQNKKRKKKNVQE